jgi:hypothetical protein
MISSFQDTLVKKWSSLCKFRNNIYANHVGPFLAHEVQFGGCSNCDYWHGSFILMTQGNRGGVPLVFSHDNSNLAYNIVTTNI